MTDDEMRRFQRLDQRLRRLDDLRFNRREPVIFPIFMLAIILFLMLAICGVLQ